MIVSPYQILQQRHHSVGVLCGSGRSTVALYLNFALRHGLFQTRGGIGAKTMNLTQKTGSMVGILEVYEHEDIMLINNANVIIRMGSDDISVFGRTAQGVRIMRLTKGEQVVSIAKLPPDEDDAALDEETAAAEASEETNE